MKRNLFAIAAALYLSCVFASAQTGAGPGQARTQNRTSADETFDLNIAERRITEHDFAASTSVEVGGEAARGLVLRIGVEVGAEEINVLLRNVSGHVRFRATLERVLERLRAERAPGSLP